MRPPVVPVGAFLLVVTSFHNAAAQSPPAPLPQESAGTFGSIALIVR
jgi:hypothetical protein